MGLCTTVNRFLKTGFLKDIESVNGEFEFYENEIDNSCSYLQDRVVIEGSMEIFFIVEKELATTGGLTTEELIVSSIPQNNESEEKNGKEDKQLTPIFWQQNIPSSYADDAYNCYATAYCDIKLLRYVVGAKNLNAVVLWNRIIPTFAQKFLEMSSITPIEDAIRHKLSTNLGTKHLQIVNESYMHNVPKNSETHFKILVVSEKFNGLSLLKRHRIINNLLKEEFENGLHALSIVATTPDQWQPSEKVKPSPPCLGGFGK
ncbi:hypothetical protein RN001_006315 [Aquatica leii]|uniref:BolA-like protein 1 n=1 Tax=Aquatica leii TaxID=1421715 RepID=A0AAN7PL06_9COLE|nr:hypothetical protein RN001_006315 [Aquatica leii]